MPNKNFKWGILGPGRIAHAFAAGLKVIDDASLYAIASSNVERATAFAAEYGSDAKIYNSYEALVNDPEVDGVYIATPHRFHFENIMLSLNAGKPVLCEKPLTVSAAEARQVIQTSREKKVFLMEALWTRYLPIYPVIRGWLDQKAIGDISLMVGTFGFAPKEKEDRWQNPELAGGTLLDMGIYPIAVSQWVMQAQPKSFVSMAHIGSTGVDELTTFSLKYENDVISQSHSSFLSNHVNDFLIYGDKGHIRIHPNFWGSTKATLAANDQELTVSKPLRASGFEYQTEEAMRCIRAGLLESPGMRHADTLANMELMDSIRAEIGLKYPFEK